MKTTAYKKIIAATSKHKRITCVQGGQGAGKTYAILRMLIELCLARSDKKVIVCQAELTKMKLSVIADFVKILKTAGIYEERRWNKSSHTYTFQSDSQIIFVGLDREDIGKGLRCNVVYFNEANKINFETYRQLSSRANKIVLDYNPNFRFWAHDEIIPRDDCEFICLKYTDNEALGEAEKEEILNYYRQGYDEDGNVKNPFWANVWRVYGLGEVGVLVGTIFTNVKSGDFPEELPHVYGMDFGMQDPTTCIKVAVDEHNKKIYADEIFYQSGLSTNQIAELAKTKTHGLIIGDNAASQTINTLKIDNRVNIIPSQKNKIIDDIRKMQGYEIVVTCNSTNLLDEFSKYVWRDKGNELPIDKYNHGIDALRYGFAYLTERHGGVKGAIAF